MNKLPTLALGGLMALATVPPAHAADWLEARQGATLFGATAAGVALGGPLGMLGGAVIGAWLTESLDEAAAAQQAREQLAGAERELAEVRSEVVQLQGELGEARDTSLQYAQLVIDQLELQMLFRTNATELTPTGRERLVRLAEFLVDNPQIAIRLDGHADPRGDDGYNRQLSMGRVSHVATTLSELGVDMARVESFSHGASQSRAAAGDYDGYALERAVRINLSRPGGNNGFAQVD